MKTILTIAAIVGVVCVLFAATFTSHASNAANRAALVQLHGDLTPGQSVEDFHAAFARHKTKKLTVMEEPDAIVVKMPFEFGASEWGLRIERAGETIVKVLMRTADGSKPDGSPQYKISMKESL